MGIRAELTTLNEAAPNWAAMYAYAQLCRIASYSNVALLERWARWAGADAWEILPASPLLYSGVALIKDDEQGIVCYGGTRNADQLAGQLLGSVQVADTDMEGRCSSYHLWYYRQRQELIEAFFSDLIPDHLLICTGHSLGGSVAMIHAAIATTARRQFVNGLVTFGQPRTGNNPFGTQIRCPYIRMVRQGDPVPHVPPLLAMQGGALTVSTFGFLSFYYIHITDQWTIGTGERPERKGDFPSLVTENIADLIAAALITAQGVADIAVNHAISAYANTTRSYVGAY